MALEGTVAVVALIVSLFALLIASTQAATQLFSTAEGYRRCAESIIGPWSSRRHRKWIWPEFRFETQYVTPHLVISTAKDSQRSWERFCSFAPEDNSFANFKEVNLTLHPRLTYAATYSGRIEDNMLKRYYRNAENRERWRSRDTMVTWLELLRQLHKLYVSYRPLRPCHNCPSLMIPNTDVYTDPAERLEEKGENLARADVGAIYRTWSWDLMPDVLRPLATTTVGDIAILALRLGMQWTVLEPGYGNMQASGNGFSLSGTEVRGLGIMFSFNSGGGHGKTPWLIPSRATDKLMCGILPGCPRLVKQDFDLIDQAGERSKSSILSRIGVVEPAIRHVDGEHQQRKNSIIPLLCAFLPQPGSPATHHFCWFWQGESPCSIFHWWEGRFALLRGAEKRCSTPRNGNHVAVEMEVLTQLRKMSELYATDFYSRWDSSNLPLGRQGPVHDVSMK